jgi:hypothetical protein
MVDVTFKPGDRVQSISGVASGQTMTVVRITLAGEAVCELADMKTGKMSHPAVPLHDLRPVPRKLAMREGT